MNSTGLLSHWRKQVFDTRLPYLWTDDEAFAWMTEAQQMFCRLTQGLSDTTTPSICVIPVVAGEATAVVSKKILRFRRASLASTGVWLDIVNIDDEPKIDLTQGRVTRMVIGMEPGLVRWVHVPKENDTVNLMVFRLPLRPLNAEVTTGENAVDNTVLEIDDVHHLALIDWMNFRAYSKHDTETEQSPEALKAKAAFEAYCFKVKLEQERSEYKPRVVAYGGI